jgi:hypothetical protein
MTQQHPPTQPGPIGVNAGGDETVATIIPYRNSRALSGYYTGIGALIPIVGFVAGPVAIWLGVTGLKRVRANPQIKGTAHAWIAIVLGVLSCLGHFGCVGLALVSALTQ